MFDLGHASQASVAKLRESESFKSRGISGLWYENKTSRSAGPWFCSDAWERPRYPFDSLGRAARRLRLSSSSVRSDGNEILLSSSWISWSSRGSSEAEIGFAPDCGYKSLLFCRDSKVLRFAAFSGFSSPKPNEKSWSNIDSIRGVRRPKLLLTVRLVRIESKAVSLKKSSSSSSPDVKIRVSSDPMIVEAGSDAAIECLLGRSRIEPWNEDIAAVSELSGRQVWPISIREYEGMILCRGAILPRSGIGVSECNKAEGRRKTLGSVMLRRSFGREGTRIGPSDLGALGKGVEIALRFGRERVESAIIPVSVGAMLAVGALGSASVC